MATVASEHRAASEWDAMHSRRYAVNRAFSVQRETGATVLLFRTALGPASCRRSCEGFSGSRTLPGKLVLLKLNLDVISHPCYRESFLLAASKRLRTSSSGTRREGGLSRRSRRRRRGEKKNEEQVTR